MTGSGEPLLPSLRVRLLLLVPWGAVPFLCASLLYTGNCVAGWIVPKPAALLGLSLLSVPGVWLSICQARWRRERGLNRLSIVRALGNCVLIAYLFVVLYVLPKILGCS